MQWNRNTYKHRTPTAHTAPGRKANRALVIPTPHDTSKNPSVLARCWGTWVTSIHKQRNTRTEKKEDKEDGA
eukprot:7297968-Pyramimonas_sp.AAC.1